MNVDEQITAKEKEIQDNHDWISKSEFISEVKCGKPIKVNTAKDLIEYTIHTKTEELLTIEHELLLDIKHPNKKMLNHDGLDNRAKVLCSEIEKLKIRLGE